MGSIKLEWETDFYPTHGDIEKEQERRGWHPAGYGGPDCIRTVKIESVIKTDKKWKTTWICNDSCD